LISLRHGTLGTHLDVPVDGAQDEIELVLDAREHLELVFVDGETPLPGVRCAVLDARGTPVVIVPASADDGSVRIGPLGAGSYHVQASRADCWTTSIEAEVRPGAARTDVQVRRVGDLVLEARDAGGLPVQGLAPEVRSIELDTDVADWVTAGRVACESPTTDLDGRVALRGLPHGTYAWSVRAGDELLQGQVVVQPAKEALALIVLP
jgi:hypothetical protein